MKSSLILAAIAGAVAFVAQTTPPGLDGAPVCVVDCGINIQKLISSGTYGPGCTDAACACKDPSFSRAVRDCSSQHCGGLNDAGSAPIGYAWGEKFCSGSGVSVTIAPPAGAPSSGTTGSVSSTPISTSTSVATIINGGSTIVSTVLSTIYDGGAGNGASGSTTNGGSTPTAITTSSFTSTVTDGTSVTTSEGATTISGINGSPVPTTLATSASETPSSSGSGNGSGSTSSSSGLGAQATAAPIAGLLAAAGLVAALL